MDAHEIIVQLKADPALLAEIPAVVLTDELLDSPNRMVRIEELLEAQGRQLEEHGRQLKEHGRQLAEHGRQIAALTAAVDQLRAQTEEHGRQIAALTAAVDQLKSEVAELRSIFARFIEATGEVLTRIEARLARIEERLP